MDPNQARDQGKLQRTSNIPKNAKLWEMCVMQGKAKFAKWPSPAASAWVKNKYIQMGGQFVGSVNEMSREEKKAHDEAEAKKAKDRGPRDTKAPVATSF